MRWLLFLPLLLAAAPAAAASDGAQVYKRCAACHLADGSGVPGAFPPLKGEVRSFANKAEGRRYLILVVTRGVAGAITVDGKTYRGMMPAQSGMTDEQIAAVLNHVTAAEKPFTADEVATIRKGGANLRADQVGALHREITGK